MFANPCSCNSLFPWRCMHLLTIISLASLRLSFPFPLQLILFTIHKTMLSFIDSLKALLISWSRKLLTHLELVNLVSEKALVFSHRLKHSHILRYKHIPLVQTTSEILALSILPLIGKYLTRSLSRNIFHVTSLHSAANICFTPIHHRGWGWVGLGGFWCL